jgi:hypothetical protein
VANRCQALIASYTSEQRCRFTATVGPFCGRHDPTLRGRQAVTSRYREAYEMRERGATYKAIGEHFGVCGQRARQMVNLYPKRMKKANGEIIS